MPIPAAAPALSRAALGAGMGFVGDVLGGIFGKKSGSKNRALQRETNALNAALSREANAQNYKMHQENLAAQEMAAKHGIAWRVADAQRSGIHPLYAMGNPGIGISPTGQSASAAHMEAPQDNFDSGAMLSNMGQNLSRAVSSMMSKEERAAAALAAAQKAKMDEQQYRFNEASIGKMNAETLLYNSEAARNAKAQIGPPRPAPGNDSKKGGTPIGSVEYKPASVTVSDGKGGDPGLVNTYRYGWDGSVYPSEDIEDALEASGIIGQLDWALGHRFSLKGPPPPPYKLKPGYKWEWNFWTGKQRPVPDRRQRPARGWAR